MLTLTMSLHRSILCKVISFLRKNVLRRHPGWPSSKKKYIRRTAASALSALTIAISGIQFIGPFFAIFVSGLGIGSPYVITVILGSVFGLVLFLALLSSNMVVDDSLSYLV